MAGTGAHGVHKGADVRHDMNVDDIPDPKLILDAPTVAAILEETGLPLAQGRTLHYLQESLEGVALEHYWHEFTPPESNREDVISFDALADSSVTPSRLRNRLVAIERSSKRVFSGTSRRPLVDKIVELLNRLGRNRKGLALKYSGTETPGHGGSERSAVWLCLVRAINANETPPQGYRSNTQDRPWASQRLEGAIQALVGFVQFPDQGRKDADEAARAIHGWVRWSIPLVEKLLASNMVRHKGKVALDITLANLARIYQDAFKKKPSLYKSAVKSGASSSNSWGLFLHAVLKRILSPDNLPSTTALQARWRRLIYADR